MNERETLQHIPRMRRVKVFVSGKLSRGISSDAFYGSFQRLLCCVPHTVREYVCKMQRNTCIQGPLRPLQICRANQINQYEVQGV